MSITKLLPSAQRVDSTLREQQKGAQVAESLRKMLSTKLRNWLRSDPQARTPTIVVQCPHPPIPPTQKAPGRGRVAFVVGAAAAVFAVMALFTFNLDRSWLIASVVVVSGSSLTALALFKRYWKANEARLEAAIAAAGVALAVVLLAAQVGVDDRRAAADARRDLLLSLGQSESLRGVSYSDVDLPSANLIGRDLRDSRLTNVTMNGANFSRALADGAAFIGLRGDGIDFSDGSFQRVSFMGAHLTGADFSRADLGGADLSGFRCDDCRFGGASLQSVTLDEFTDFTGSVADHATIWPVGKDVSALGVLAPGQDLSGIRLADYDLNLLTDSAPGDDVQFLFQNTTFRGADLRGIDLTRFVIDGSQLQGADLSGAVFGDVLPQRVVLNSATKVDRAMLGPFVDVDAQSIVLNFAANLSGESLSHVAVAPGADIEGTSFAGSTITDSSFAGSSLAVSFTSATLVRVDLSGAILDGADFSGTDLRNLGFEGLDDSIRSRVDGPSLRLTYYDSTTQWPSGFEGYLQPSPDESQKAIDEFRASGQTDADVARVEEVVHRGYGWFDVGGTLDVRHPVVVAQPERLPEIQPYGFYRPPLMNWIIHGTDASGPNNSSARVVPTNLVNFQGQGSLFRNRTFDESNLYLCDLRGGDLTGSTFRRVNLSGCNLSTAIMSPADGSDDQAGRTQYAGMVFDERTRFPRGFEIPPDAIRLEGSVVGEDLSSVDISGNNLPRIDATGASFDGALIYSTTFAASNFSGASFVGADAHAITLSGGVSLFASDLTDASFADSHMRGANLGELVAYRTVFSGADLTNADFSGAILEEADFTGATLVGANLTGASLTNANFSGADLSGVTLDPGSLSDAITDASTKLPTGYV